MRGRDEISLVSDSGVSPALPRMPVTSGGSTLRERQTPLTNCRLCTFTVVSLIADPNLDTNLDSLGVVQAAQTLELGGYKAGA
jgi:hypothetical protein